MSRHHRHLPGLAAACLTLLMSPLANAAEKAGPTPPPVIAATPLVDPDEAAAGKAWRDAREAFGDDDGRTMTAAHEYAQQLFFNQKTADGIALMSWVFDRVQALTGADSRSSAVIASDLGWMLLDSKQYARAEPVLIVAWTYLKAQPDPNDKNRLRILEYLTETQVALGRGAERLADYDALIAARRKANGPDDDDILKALASKADALVIMKRPGDAEPLLREIVEARRASGGDPRGLLRARKRLAESLRDQGRLDEAVVIYREVWRAEQATPDASGIFVMISPQELVDILRRLGRASEAAEVLRTTWETQKRTLGPENGITQLTGRSIAELLGEMGATSEEEVIRRQFWLSRRKEAGETSLAAYLAATELSATWLRLGRVQEAYDLQVPALEGLRQTPTTNADDIAFAVGNLASILYSLRRYEEAAPLEARNLASLTARLGPDARDTLASAQAYAITLDALGRTSEAEAEYRRVLAARRRTLGDTDGDTLSSINTLAIHLRETGRAGEALPLFREQTAAMAAGAGRSIVPTSSAISAYGNLGFAAAGAGSYAESYAAFRQASVAVRERYASREATGSVEEAKSVLVRYRHIFTGQVAVGWALAHPK